MDKILESNAIIHIVSGEGAFGTRELYTGKRTKRALKMRLTKERSNGDRWARAEYLVGVNHYPATSEYDSFDDEIWEVMGE